MLAGALILGTTYFRSTVTHITVDDKYQAVENDNCFRWFCGRLVADMIFSMDSLDRVYIHFRMAEVGSLSARAKMATKVFVKFNSV